MSKQYDPTQPPTPEQLERMKKNRIKALKRIGIVMILTVIFSLTLLPYFS